MPDDTQKKTLLDRLLEQREADVAAGRISPTNARELGIPPAFRGKGRNPKEFVEKIGGLCDKKEKGNRQDFERALRSENAESAVGLPAGTLLGPGSDWPHRADTTVVPDGSADTANDSNGNADVEETTATTHGTDGERTDAGGSEATKGIC